MDLRSVVDGLAKEWHDAGGYDAYSSILEFLDERYDRKFYLSIDPNDLIHERMRSELGVVHNDVGIVVSGLMECYDFCNRTRHLSAEEIRDYQPYD